jgi:hypothetical protein
MKQVLSRVETSPSNIVYASTIGDINAAWPQSPAADGNRSATR